MNAYLSLFKVSFLDAKEYIQDFFLRIMSIPFEMLIVYYLWNFIYLNSGNSVFSLSFNQVILYFLIQRLLGRAISHTEISEKIQDEINRGGIITYLVRPITYQSSWMARVSPQALIDFIIGFIIILLVFLFTGNILFDIRLLLFIVAVVTGYFISLQLNYLIGIITFWIRRTDSIWWIYSLIFSLVSGALVPLSIFREDYFSLLMFLPFQAVYFLPAIILVNFNLKTQSIYLFISIMWALMLYFLNQRIWYHGVKHFTADGS